MSSSITAFGAHQPGNPQSLDATNIANIANTSQDTTTMNTESSAAENVSVSPLKRLVDPFSRITHRKEHNRGKSRSKAPLASSTSHEAFKREIKRPQRAKSVLEDPESFINPRTAPEPGAQQLREDKNSGAGMISEGLGGSLLTSGMDSAEVQDVLEAQKAFAMVVRLVATQPEEAAMVAADRRQEVTYLTHLLQGYL